MRIELTKPYTRGADVRHVQERLVAHGYRVATDGIYGPASCNAVKAVQALYGLTVDGIVDDKTLAVLDAPPLIIVQPSKHAKSLVTFMHSLLEEIYLWGGFGQELTAENVNAVALKMDTSAANARRTVALFEKKAKWGQTNMHGYDCSGAVSRGLYKMGMVDKKRNCNHLWDMCEEITRERLIPGDLLFRQRTSGNNYHVGVYVGDGKVIEAKGRDDGVVIRGIYKSGTGYWNKFGRLRCLYENA